MRAIDIRTERAGAVAVVKLAGRLDVANAPELSHVLQALIDSGELRLLFDCEGLTYVSSAGLHVFLVAAQCLDKRGGCLAFCSLGRNLGQIFAMTDLARLYPVFATREAALKAVSEESGWKSPAANRER